MKVRDVLILGILVLACVVAVAAVADQRIGRLETDLAQRRAQCDSLTKELAVAKAKNVLKGTGSSNGSITGTLYGTEE